jgi:hypothetical protein
MPIRWGHGPAAERGCGGGLPSGWRQISRFGRNVVVPGYFKMRSRFVDYPGLFVIHCHILAHEDRGMMMVVEVRPLQLPYAHQ